MSEESIASRTARYQAQRRVQDQFKRRLAILAVIFILIVISMVSAFYLGAV